MSMNSQKFLDAWKFYLLFTKVKALTRFGEFHVGEVVKFSLLSLCRALWRILRAKMENLAG